MYEVTQTPAAAYALVDVETTGLTAADHRVLSITVITIEPSGRVSDEFHTLLDPGCDPGPVHVHGLTRERLSGAPQFAAIQPTLTALLTGRVMVAHNAEFDYAFIDEEFGRCGTSLPVTRRLCTLALARRVAPPTPDHRLGSLAAYYGVPQQRAHDSLDDTRVLTGVFAALLADAARLGIDTPVLRCPPERNNEPRVSQYRQARATRKLPCQFVNPGRLTPGNPLVQGMKVAITGATHIDRAELTRRGDTAGLDMVSTVSRQTSLLVTNDTVTASSKLTRATAHQTPILDEQTFCTLLLTVSPGITKATAKSTTPPTKKPPTAKPPTPTGPLSARRVLVLGGTHDDAAAARERIGELGGSAAVNLSRNVTDILALPGAQNDPRYHRAETLDIPIRDITLLSTTTSTAAGLPAPPDQTIVLSRGQAIDLPTNTLGATWTFRTSWNQATSLVVDVVAFIVDPDEQVSSDDDFVFYNQPNGPGVRLAIDGPTEQSITIDLADLPAHCTRIVIAAALDDSEATFADVGAIEIDTAPSGEAAVLAHATLNAATSEQTLRLAEIYRRGDLWRLRAVGQGYDTGLAALAESFGIDVDD